MDQKAFPVIDLIATGNNIRRLRTERGMSVRDLQHYFGFEQPQAIYKWQKGACLPSVDNLYALGTLLEVPMDQILVPAASTRHSYIEQQADACCSSISGYGRVRCGALHFSAARGGDTGPGGGLQVSLLILNSRKEYGDVCAPGRGKGRPRSWRQGGFARGEAGDGERPTLSYITSSAERYCHF